MNELITLVAWESGTSVVYEDRADYRKYWVKCSDQFIRPIEYGLLEYKLLELIRGYKNG